MRALVVVSLLCVVAVGTVLQAPAAAEPQRAATASQSVTMFFVRVFDVACNCYKARVSGQVSNGKAGEDVVVLQQYCGRAPRSVAAASTRVGGSWETEVGPVARPGSPVAESYRARWNATVSAPVTFVGRLESVSGKRLRSGRQEVNVVTPNVNPVSLQGRAVVLQRRTGTQWRRIASARLATHRTRFYTFTATFTVPRRGWALRALVPAKTAAPCFSSAVSEPWRS
jgi:hypothetical protein